MFKVNDVNDVVLVSSLLTLKTYFTLCSNVSIVNFEQVNASWPKWERVRKFFRYFAKTRMSFIILNEMKHLLLSYYFLCHNSNSVEAYWEKTVRNEVQVKWNSWDLHPEKFYVFYKSIRPQVFCKKSILKRFNKIHRETPVLESLI